VWRRELRLVRRQVEEYRHKKIRRIAVKRIVSPLRVVESGLVPGKAG
jgi:hypothetical protein